MAAVPPPEHEDLKDLLSFSHKVMRHHEVYLMQLVLFRDAQTCDYNHRRVDSEALLWYSIL